MIENSQNDKKSLRAITKPNPDWNEIAKDCVCFANAYGGRLLFGIEDDEDAPPLGQKVAERLVSQLVKQVQGRTINVSVVPEIKQHENGAEYLELLVQRTASTVACTSKGRYYMRVEDDCKPVMPDELPRLISDKPLPIPREGGDRVSITIEKRIVKKEIIKFMEKANELYTLKLREIISLGLIAQNTSLTAFEFAKSLDLKEQGKVKSWMGRLLELGLVQQKGKTKGTSYFINPSLLKELDFKGRTTLKEIEPHRLRELIKEDLKIYGESAFGDIHQRIGKEIPLRRIRYEIELLLKSNEIRKRGEKRWRTYYIATR